MQRGFAKKHFVDSYQHIPWLNVESSHDLSKWPFIHLLMNRQQLAYLDYFLALQLLQNQMHNQSLALFICHVLMAAREGHLCVEVKEQNIFPQVEQIWINDASLPLSQVELEELKQFILQGSKIIPSSLLTIMEDSYKEDHVTTPLCLYKNHFYLQKYWVFETLFLNFLKKHVETPPHVKIDSSILSQQLAVWTEQKKLLPEQARAISMASTFSLSLITGGPGTGKTYTAGRLIQVYWDSLSEQQQGQFEIALAAPTGKAAANLQKSLSQVTSQLKNFPTLQAKTLHHLLGLKNSSFEKSTPRLSADLVIVDESSMIDFKMMAYLFQAVKKGSRLILLGDSHQLPSVEAGSFFMDLINLKKEFLTIPCTELTVCLRTELSSIVSFAQSINEGKSKETLQMLQNRDIEGISRLHLSADRKEAQKEFIQHIMNFFPIQLKYLDAQQIIELFDKIRILSPVRKGDFGVDGINQLIWNHISQMKLSSGWLAIPIMVIVNDYKRDLFNGETGVLIRKLPLQSLTSDDYALFPCREGGQPRQLSALLLPKYELAYCLSVHKSQGSEFQHVILMLPDGSERFGREVFYTGVTRARQHIEVWGSDFTIEKTIALQGFRLSGVKLRFY